MGVRFSVAGRDIVESVIVASAQDLTIAIAAAAGEIAIIVGANLLNTKDRFRVDRAIQEMRDVLREDQWPEGAFATNFAHEVITLETKVGLTTGNAADIAAAVLTEDSIALIYGNLFGAGQGSSVNYASAIRKLRDEIRRRLSSTGGAGLTSATGILTASANPIVVSTVIINGRTYTFVAAPAVADDIDIGVAATDSLDNLIAAINRGPGEGTLYGTGTTENPDVKAAAGASDTIDFTAKVPGPAGNSITTTEVSAQLSWGAATLLGGT
ncbi:hypothetical protein LCGC14_0903160 [marine sediment metagenome]|uniref:Uncharacterized protein n=1 Tax=marine sediment metagenome TaxID=412755 RepID=A0A0F9P0L1_9ZZZZ